MLDDKIMVSDALNGVNGELTKFGEMIPQTENKELKQCLKQIRNESEMSQESHFQHCIQVCLALVTVPNHRMSVKK